MIEFSRLCLTTELALLNSPLLPRAFSADHSLEDDALARLERAIAESLRAQAAWPEGEGRQGVISSEAHQLETASYVQQLSVELGALARNADLPMLAYFLDMAAVEARDVGARLAQDLCESRGRDR